MLTFAKTRLYPTWNYIPTQVEVKHRALYIVPSHFQNNDDDPKPNSVSWCGCYQHIYDIVIHECTSHSSNMKNFETLWVYG
jgi:hypothetical protein